MALQSLFKIQTWQLPIHMNTIQNLHPLNLETAEKSIRLLATAFFHQDLKTLEAHFGISPLQVDEAFEALENYLGKDDFTSLAPPPIGSQLVLEKDEICADDENSSIRLYRLNYGGWGYEMDVFMQDKSCDLTMRGELPGDFGKNPHGIRFHLFEVM
ncbi:hypothetical protein CTI10_014270 [Delftia acidovorans]|uniref:Uncharacterized protein n=1 Tax=Chryseobacterium sp. B5 TaxID=2050562 RepID=A0A2G7TBC4_9FLAO|nr:hypothetical protein CTI10_014270 [Delftia acidovorans]